MKKVALDTETALIAPGLKAPPLACVSYAYREYGSLVSGVLDRHEGVRFVEQCLRDPNVFIIGQNFAFDAVVICAAAPHLLPLFFAAYEAGRVEDTMIKEQLKDLANGRLGFRPKGYYSLEKLAKRYTNIDLEKDTWRLRYGTLIPIPIWQWPEGAIEYARLDAVSTLIVDELQPPVVDSFPQACEAFALQLVATWGVRTDAEKVEALEKRLLGIRRTLGEQLQEVGLLRADGVQDTIATKRLVEQCWPREYGPLPSTDSYANWEDEHDSLPIQGVSTAGEVIMRCRHPSLTMLSEFKKTSKVLSTYLPALRAGTVIPICTNFNVLQANGRTSSWGPNMQNPPREGGVRECVVPRPGNKIVSCDFDTLENRTLAQTLKYITGGSTLVRKYQQDPDFDVHSDFAANVLGIPYEHALALKKAKDPEFGLRRQEMKQIVYGVPGGMGVPTLRVFAFKGSGGKVDLTHERGTFLRHRFLDFIPEMRPYFDWCGLQTLNERRATIQQFHSGRVRGGCFYTDLANGMWSALANDGAKAWLFQLVKRCYVVTTSALYGARVNMFMHDEALIEAPDEQCHDAGHEMAQLGVDVMQSYTPDVPQRMAPAMMDCWRKGAATYYDKNGRLAVEPPKEKKAA